MSVDGVTISNGTIIRTEQLRRKVREYSIRQRDVIRTNIFDGLRFGLGEIKEHIQELDNLNENDVTGLASRIKRRKHATEEDMYRLSHAFLQSVENIRIFSKIPGAIQVLIKALTSKDSSSQLSAAECLCNLSLGEIFVCDKVAYLCGSYLITYIHSTESQLVHLSLWTIANILSVCSKGAHILMQMKLLPLLWSLYTDENVVDSTVDYRKDAAICLQLIVSKSSLLEIVSSEDRDFVVEHITKKSMMSFASEYHLQFIFQFLFEDNDIICKLSNSCIEYLIQFSLNNIYETKNLNEYSQNLRLLYGLRTLSNLIACRLNSQDILLQKLNLIFQSDLSELLNKLLDFNHTNLIPEILWFFKNLYIRGLLQDSNFYIIFNESLRSKLSQIGISYMID